MKLFTKAKDGGPASPVDAFFLIEIKNLFSIALLRFNKGGREQYHTHAFNALTWFLHGNLVEEDISSKLYKYTHSLVPKYTPKSKNHRVFAVTTSWCLTIRGPWDKTWTEHSSNKKTKTTYTHGRIKQKVETL